MAIISSRSLDTVHRDSQENCRFAWPPGRAPKDGQRPRLLPSTHKSPIAFCYIWRQSSIDLCSVSLYVFWSRSALLSITRKGKKKKKT